MRHTQTLLLSGWMIISSLTPLALAEREIHTENPDGSVSVVIERTTSEQERAENSYTTPDGGTITYFDSYTGKPTSRENFQKTYETQLNMVQGSNNRIVEEAHEAFKQGVINHEEFMNQHSIVKMANAGLEATRNQTVSTLRDLKPKPSNETADGKKADKIVLRKSRVLVSS